MKAQCPDCNTVYIIDESRIPEGGAALRCKRCQNKFLIERPVAYLGIAEEHLEDTKEEESVPKGEQKVEEVSETPEEANNNTDEISTTKDETTKKTGFLDKAFTKLANGLGITSGHGLIALGILWFIYCTYMYFTASPGSAIEESTRENFLNQAVMGVIIIGIGALLKKIK
jgi:predicted Zn finger-like uncharacterized protein